MKTRASNQPPSMIRSHQAAIVVCRCKRGPPDAIWRVLHKLPGAVGGGCWVFHVLRISVSALRSGHSTHKQRLLNLAVPTGFVHLRPLDHLLSAAPTMLADRSAVEHRRKLHDPLVGSEMLHRCARAVGAEELRDRIMCVAKGSDLWQVRDADH